MLSDAEKSRLGRAASPNVQILLKNVLSPNVPHQFLYIIYFGYKSPAKNLL